MSGGNPVRMAMVGAGRWASALALEIAQTDGAELVSVFDTDAEASARFASDFGVEGADSLEALAADPHVDAGITCVPNASHSSVAVALARAGKHVFVPRPIANNVRAGKEIVHTALASGVTLFVDHTSTFSPELNALHEASSAGRAGALIAAHILRSADWTSISSKSSWHLSPRECPGGPATLLGVSAAATLIRFLGRPVSVRGSLASGLTESRVPDVTTFLIEHEGGAHSTLVTSGVSAVPSDLFLFYGTKGVLMNGPTATRSGSRVVCAESSSSVIQDLDLRPLNRSAMRMFVDRIRGGKEPDCQMHLALEALATVEAGLKSVSDDRRISVGELL